MDDLQPRTPSHTSSAGGTANGISHETTAGGSDNNPALHTYAHTTRSPPSVAEGSDSRTNTPLRPDSTAQSALEPVKVTPPLNLRSDAEGISLFGLHSSLLKPLATHRGFMTSLCNAETETPSGLFDFTVCRLPGDATFIIQGTRCVLATSIVGEPKAAFQRRMARWQKDGGEGVAGVPLAACWVASEELGAGRGRRQIGTVVALVAEASVCLDT